MHRRPSRWFLPVGAVLMLGLWAGRGLFRRWTLAQLRRVRRGSHRVRTALGAVEYQLVGEGTVVLLVHGAPGGSDGWRAYAPLLDADFALLSPSRPGYLGTPLQSGRTFAQQADLFAALLDELGIAQVALFGHSMGGPVALAFARQHPARVSRLVLLSAITHPNAVTDLVEEAVVGTSWVPHQFQSFFFWVSHRLLHYVPSVAVRAAVWASYDGPDEAACIDAILASPTQRRLLQAAFDGGVPLRYRQRGYDNDVRQIASLAPQTLKGIRTATLVLHSGYDASVPFQHAQFAKEHLADALLVQIGGCGHLALMGPDGVATGRVLANFLAVGDRNRTD